MKTDQNSQIFNNFYIIYTINFIIFMKITKNYYLHEKNLSIYKLYVKHIINF